jgi:hypothetical protein
LTDPNIWRFLTVLFVVAGALNLARGLRAVAGRGRVRITLGVSCFFWAGCAYLYRFVQTGYGYAAGGIALAIMLYAAYLSARHNKG